MITIGILSLGKILKNCNRLRKVKDVRVAETVLLPVKEQPVTIFCRTERKYQKRRAV